MNTNIKALIGATLYGFGVTPYAVIIATWFSIYWSVAFIVTTLFLYFKFMNWLFRQ